MSLMIDYKTVIRVLLADGWHTCDVGTFNFDAYEFDDIDNANEREARGKHGAGPYFVGSSTLGGNGTGFEFYTEYKTRICGPITSLLAVECDL